MRWLFDATDSCSEQNIVFRYNSDVDVERSCGRTCRAGTPYTSLAFPTLALQVLPWQLLEWLAGIPLLC